MALKSSRRMRLVRLDQIADTATTITLMRTLTADMRLTTDRTAALINVGSRLPAGGR